MTGHPNQIYDEDANRVPRGMSTLTTYATNKNLPRITQHLYLAKHYTQMNSAKMDRGFPPGYRVNHEGGQFKDMLSKLTYDPQLLGELLPIPLGIPMPHLASQT